MLQNSFIQFSNRATELAIWKNNILHWDEFNPERISQIQGINGTKIQQEIQEWKIHIEDHKFVGTHLPSAEHWRLFKDFSHCCCFLDIETTGLSKYSNSITTIAGFDGTQSRVFVQGQNMHEFQNYIKQFPMIITYNGKTFDFPFIKTHLNLQLDQIHIDLRYPLAKLGFKGGLKKIEQDLGINRDSTLKDINGYEAVRLWYRYKSGDVNALELLKKYNVADVENLQPLMNITFEKLKEQEFLRHL